MNFKTLHSAVLSSAVAVLGATAVISTATPASATPAPVSFGYTCLTGTTANCATGQNQFKTTVSAVGTNQVMFTFLNTMRPGGSNPSSILGVYFDDLLPQLTLNVNSAKHKPTVTSSAGVANFAQGKVGFAQNYGFTTDFSLVTKNPNASVLNGINPGETLSVVFDILGNYANPFNAVITDLQKGGLRVGVYAAGFHNATTVFEADRATFRNSAVPEPFTMMGSGVAVAMGAMLKRKTAKRDKEKVQVG